MLPIFNSNANPNVEFMSEALAKELVNALPHRSDLRIKLPAKATDISGQEINLQKVGRELDAEILLVAVARPRDSRPFFQVALINAVDGSKLWENEYAMAPANIQLLQQELSLNIAFYLQLSLSEEEKRFLALLGEWQSRPPAAVEAYLRGRYCWRKRDSENIQKAISFFNQAIELDSLYAEAHAGLADCYVLLNSVAYGSMSTEEAMSKAKAAAKDALAINDNLCEAHTALGVIKLKYDWNWQEAAKEFTQAITINPDYAPAHFWYSQLLALSGNMSMAIGESETAKSLDPFSSLSEMNLGRVLYLAKEYDRAITLFLKLLDDDSNNKSALYMLGLLFQQKGWVEKSMESFERLYSLKPDLAAAPLGYAYAKAGRRDEALRLLDELKQIKRERYISDQELAIIYLGLDDKDNAFFFLEQACKEKAQSLPFIKVDPFFDSIRSDPRYAGLARCTKTS